MNFLRRVILELSLNQKVLALAVIGLFLFLSVLLFTPRSEWVDSGDKFGIVRTLVSSGSRTSGNRVGAVIDLENGQTIIIDTASKCGAKAGDRIRLSVHANTKNIKDLRYSCLNVVEN